jgi:hypothetical protein
MWYTKMKKYISCRASTWQKQRRYAVTFFGLQTSKNKKNILHFTTSQQQQQQNNLQFITNIEKNHA